MLTPRLIPAVLLALICCSCAHPHLKTVPIPAPVPVNRIPPFLPAVNCNDMVSDRALAFCEGKS